MMVNKFNDFNSSIAFDCRMYREDIQGSIAHATMLCECGIISRPDCEQILTGLEGILSDIESGNLQFDKTEEDIHMFIEAELTKRIGEAGKKLHTARSRNDQVATDLRLYLRKEVNEIQDLLINLIDALVEKVKNHDETIMPGYTHLQRAQPITFANHLDAYVQMFRRDFGRLFNVNSNMMGNCPLGSGALAGTTYPIDRKSTAKSLGFDFSCDNTLDGVSDRDFVIELASALSIIMMHMSRFSEEIILWCSWEFKFIELDDAYATGSSIMPQKKNPDAAELIRGKAGRVFGDLQALLVMMKGLPLSYNKDMQEDKHLIFDAVDTVKMCLEVFTPMLASIKINEGNMRDAALKGFLNATDCADYLANKGMAFRDAHRITREMVSYCMQNEFDLESLPLDKYKQFSQLFDNDIYDAINLENCVFRRNINEKS